MKQQPTREIGYTLIELLLGILLGSALVLGVLSSTQQTLKVASLLRQAAVAEQDFERAELVMRQLAEAANTFHALPGVIVQEEGGSLGAAIRRHTSLPPAAGSSILVFRLLDPEISMRFRAANGNLAEAPVWCKSGFGLPYGAANLPPAAISNFVLLTLDGTFDIESTKAESTAGCPGAFFFRNTPLLSGQQFRHSGRSGQLPSAGSWFALMNVRDQAALYLDSQGMLRRVSLLNHSNRAVAGRFSSFTGAISRAAGAPMLSIRLTAKAHGKEHSFGIGLLSGSASPIDMVF